MTGLPQRLQWYKNRLAAMSPAEILFRINEAARRRRDSWSPPRLTPPPSPAPLPQIPGLRARLDAWNIPQEIITNWQNHAQQTQQGRVTFFGQTANDCVGNQRWHTDPQTGALWPRDPFCFVIDYRHTSGPGDIKFVWELNRLQYLQPIAALASKRKDADLACFCLGEIESWIDNNPPFHGVNWNSGIELALRVVSIVTVVTLIGEHVSPSLGTKISACLHQHAHWIARYPSRYSSGNNHAAAEALGLLVIGALCPQLPEADQWKQQGWHSLCEAIQRLILPDGAGAEQATAYAAFTLEIGLAGLIIARAAALTVPDFFLRRLTLGGEYLRWLIDAAGQVPLIGDDDNACIFGFHQAGDKYIASILAAIAATTGRADLSPPRPQPDFRTLLFGTPPAPDFAPTGARCFAHGGMTIGRHPRAQGDVLLAFDHGSLGYLSIAAHGHADALALWLHLGAQPVFVDAGTYLYHAAADQRAAFRSTAAHNSLRVEGANASIMAGNFNWSRKAAATLRSFVSRGNYWQVEAEHDGYQQIFACLHRRSLHVSPASGAVIEDMLVPVDEAPPTPHQVELAFLLHPALTARREGQEIALLNGEQLILRMRHESGLETTIGAPDTPQSGWYSSEFGSKQATTRIVFSGMLTPGQKAITHLFWSA